MPNRAGLLQPNELSFLCARYLSTFVIVCVTCQHLLVSKTIHSRYLVMRIAEGWS